MQVSLTPVPPRHRTRASEAATETAYALLDGLWTGPVGLAVLDRELRLVDLNDAMAETLEIAPRDAAGRTLADIARGWSAALQEEMERVADACRVVVETGRPFLNLAAHGRGPDGAPREWLCSFFPVVAPSGASRGVLAMLSDATDDREREAALARARDDAQRALHAERDAGELRRNVLGIVSHDLRTPLAAMAGWAQLLVRDRRLPPELAHPAGRILASAARMDRIISMLLDYARLQAGQDVPLVRRRCDLAAIADTVVEELRATHPGREVRVQGEGDPAGEWDPDRIAQALSNLLSNALSYSPASSEVELRWRDEGSQVRVEVWNEGPPIPAELAARIFEPFQRAAHPRGTGEGLGLGLFIVRAIAAGHGGEALVRSSAGQGTTFTLRLPRPDRG